MTQDPEISEQHFQQLLADLGKENLAEFSKRFYDDLKNTSAMMLDAEKQSAWDTVKLHAHSLKSSTLCFGLLRLSRVAAAIELECKHNTRPSPVLLATWPERMTLAITALDARLGEMGVTAMTTGVV